MASGRNCQKFKLVKSDNPMIVLQESVPPMGGLLDYPLLEIAGKNDHGSCESLGFPLLFGRPFFSPLFLPDVYRMWDVGRVFLSKFAKKIN